jgi:Patatin-like phospholipase
MKDTTNQPKERIRLGICLAGSISAGAYLAGVMDCLIEALNNMEEARANNPNLPEVIIDVIGGASGGGVTAALTALCLFGKKPEKGEKSLFYKTWVDMYANSKEEEPIHRFLKTDDLLLKDANKNILSLLNTEVIDRLVHKVEEEFTFVGYKNKPSYVSDNLAVMITLTNLNGTSVDLKMNSGDYDRYHRMYMHKDIIQFKVNKSEDDKTGFINLDFQKGIKEILAAASATCAFPMAFKPRKVRRPKTVIMEQLIENLNVVNDCLDSTNSFKAIKNKNVTTLNVDGGATNNEPFDDLKRYLDDLKKDAETKNNNIIEKTIILMIDPFPSDVKKLNDDKTKSVKPYVELSDSNIAVPRNIFSYAMAIISALRNQSMFKLEEIIKARSQNDEQFLIIPSKRGTHDALASSSIGAFGGFLERSFRDHDYELGKKNCKSFLVNYFQTTLNNQQKQKIVWIAEDDKGELSVTTNPKISVEKIEEIKRLLDKRLVALYDKSINIIIKSNIKKEEESPTKEIESVNSIMGKLGFKKATIGNKILIKIVIWSFKRNFTKMAIVNKISKMMMQHIVTDLNDRDFIKTE